MLYNQIIELLMWENKPPIIDDITDLYNRKCLMIFNHIVYADKKLRKSIYNELKEMNRLDYKINLISPELKMFLYRSTLTGDTDKVIASIKEFIKREMFIHGIGHHKIQPGYDISCTHYINKNYE